MHQKQLRFHSTQFCPLYYLSNNGQNKRIITSRTKVGLLARDDVKPRLHHIHVAGYKYPGRATCIHYPDTSGYMSP